VHYITNPCFFLRAKNDDTLSDVLNCISYVIFFPHYYQYVVGAHAVYKNAQLNYTCNYTYSYSLLNKDQRCRICPYYTKGRAGLPCAMGATSCLPTDLVYIKCLRYKLHISHPRHVVFELQTILYR
jgi:hypothetical protein